MKYMQQAYGKLMSESYINNQINHKILIKKKKIKNKKKKKKTHSILVNHVYRNNNFFLHKLSW